MLIWRERKILLIVKNSDPTASISNSPLYPASQNTPLSRHVYLASSTHHPLPRKLPLRAPSQSQASLGLTLLLTVILPRLPPLPSPVAVSTCSPPTIVLSSSLVMDVEAVVVASSWACSAEQATLSNGQVPELMARKFDSAAGRGLFDIEEGRLSSGEGRCSAEKATGHRTSGGSRGIRLRLHSRGSDGRGSRIRDGCLCSPIHAPSHPHLIESSSVMLLKSIAALPLTCSSLSLASCCSSPHHHCCRAARVCCRSPITAT
jgi:hypothetical protein